MPTRAGVLVLLAMTLCGAVPLLAGVSLDGVTWAVGAALSIGLILVVLQVLLNRAAGVTLELDRTTPKALALGLGHVFSLTLSNSSGRLRKVQVFDDTDPSLAVEGMPQSVVIPPRSALTLQYTVTPRVRGDVMLGPAFVKLRGRLGFWNFCSDWVPRSRCGCIRISLRWRAMPGLPMTGGCRRSASKVSPGAAPAPISNSCRNIGQAIRFVISIGVPACVAAGRWCGNIRMSAISVCCLRSIVVAGCARMKALAISPAVTSIRRSMR